MLLVSTLRSSSGAEKNSALFANTSSEAANTHSTAVSSPRTSTMRSQSDFDEASQHQRLRELSARPEYHEIDPKVFQGQRLDPGKSDTATTRKKSERHDAEQEKVILSASNIKPAEKVKAGSSTQSPTARSRTPQLDDMRSDHVHESAASARPETSSANEQDEKNLPTGTDRDLIDWLEVTGYHNVEYRKGVLGRHRKRQDLEAQIAQLDREDEQQPSYKAVLRAAPPAEPNIKPEVRTPMLPPPLPHRTQPNPRPHIKSETTPAPTPKRTLAPVYSAVDMPSTAKRRKGEPL